MSREMERLDAIERSVARLRAPQSTEERSELAAAQARADSVAGMFGTEASAPVPGESCLQYRKRLLAKFQPYSERFAAARLDGLDSATLAPLEDLIYADAAATAKAPESYGPGELHAIRERDAVGRLVTRYVGDIGAFMAPFQSPGVAVSIIPNPKKA
jgi:hypothetical protein